MSFTQRLHRRLVPMSIALTLVACSENPSTPTPTATATVSAVTVSGGPTGGSTFRLTAAARFSDGSSRDVTNEARWESSDPQIAMVTSGVVTATGTGEVDVRAVYREVTGSLRVFVTPTSVVSIDILGAGSGSSFQLTALARMADGSSEDVTLSARWATSDTRVASVTPTGLVTVVGSGDVEIRATYQNVTASRQFRVSSPEVFTLSGEVRGPSPERRPIAHAVVRILDGRTPPTITDQMGRFSFPNLPAGRLLIEVTKEGFETREMDHFLQGDARIVIELALRTSGSQS